MTEVPSAGYGGHYRLKDIIEKRIFPAKKVIFEFKDNSVYVDGKVIQGLKITDSNAYIKCIHYTAWENATQIRSMRRIEPSLEDPFVYLAPEASCRTGLKLPFAKNWAQNLQILKFGLN